MCLPQKARWSLWTVVAESLFVAIHHLSFVQTLFHIISQLIQLLVLHTHIHTSIWRGNKGLCSRESDIHAFFTWGLNLWICYTGRHTMLRSVYHCSFLVSVFVMMLFLLRKVMELSNVNCVQYIHRKMSILPVCESEILYTMYTVSPVWYLSYVLKQPMFKKISFLTC